MLSNVFVKSTILASTWKTLSVTALCLGNESRLDQTFAFPRVFILVWKPVEGMGLLGVAPIIIIPPPWETCTVDSGIRPLVWQLDTCEITGVKKEDS